MKKIFGILILLFVMSNVVVFADEKSIYLQLLQSNKMAELEEHLKKWEANEPNNPEMFIGYFNYYLNMARNETIVFGGKNPPKGDTYFSITDPKTGDNIGYMYGEVKYDPSYAEKALQIINRGLAIAPSRLDMHFGKTRLLAELHSYGKQKEYLLKIFDIGKTINNKWLWSDGKVLEDAENVFVNSIHDYISEWYNANDKIAFASVREALTIYYPDNPIGYNDCGLFYAQNGDMANAEKYFLSGYRVDTEDEVLIGNLAYLYEAKKNVGEAIKYYKIMAKSMNPKYSEYAKKRITELSK